MAPPTQERVFYREQRTRPLIVFGTTENFAVGTRSGSRSAASSPAPRCSIERTSSCSARRRIRRCSRRAGIDPIGKMVRVGAERYQVVGVFDKRPAVGGFNAGQDDFVVIPYTAYQRQFGLGGMTIGRGAATRRRSCRFRSPRSRATA